MGHTQAQIVLVWSCSHALHYPYTHPQEEQKVAALSEKLASLGVDVEVLLSSIQPQEDEEEEDELQ